MRATRWAWRWSTRRSSITSAGSGSDSASSSMISIREEMIPIGLLISWAMPAARVPRPASFSDWRTERSKATRSVMSWMSRTAPAGRPPCAKEAAFHVLDHPAAPERVVLDGVEGEDGDLAAQQSLERLRDHLAPVVREDVEKDPPQDFARGEAVALLHGAVPRDHTPLEVERDQSLAQALDDAPDELLAYLRLPGERRHREVLGLFHPGEDPDADGGAHEHHEADGDVGPLRPRRSSATPATGRRAPDTSATATPRVMP